MHGEKVQSERTRILTAFLSGEYDVLVCTGVLGRGLDLRCVKQVRVISINWDNIFHGHTALLIYMKNYARA